MDNELEQLLEQLKELANETQSQSQSQTSTQDYTQTTQQQDNTDVEEQFRAWKEIGIIRFTSKYQHLPKFSQIINMIIPKADQKVLSDIQAGKVRDEYLDYLEEAYRDVIKEVASFSKELLSSQTQYIKQTAPSQQKQPDYDMKKYYNDYKKYLERITAKEVAGIKFLDGIEDNGRVRETGIPKSSIRENIVSLDEN
jgi:hypothetical protein